MKEYEYSFKVDSIKPYIDYCLNNKYKKISVTKENRKVYECVSNSNLIARLTTSDNNETILDFKNVCEKSDDLNVSNESLPVKINKNNKATIYSILDVLGFKIKGDNIRTRYIFEKDNIKFEIDEYEIPRMNVIAIEGNRDKIDSIYNDLRNNKENL